MFFPRGIALYENLATSYVLVDALVDDLCEGGFSGAVELVLRDADGHIIINRGAVVAAIEGRAGKDDPTARVYSHISIPDLAANSRSERGRISIYGYSARTAEAVAGRVVAQSLYTGLSTEFADLEKMVAKLVRERDREWFIEITTGGGVAALIHLTDELCHIITSSAGESDMGRRDLAESGIMRGLLDECNRSGGTFDVYFRQGDEVITTLARARPVEQEREAEPAFETPDQDSYKPASASPDQYLPEAEPEAEPEAVPDIEMDIEPEARPAAYVSGSLAEDLEMVKTDLAVELDPEAEIEATSMEVVKRLMGEIAETVEATTRAVEQRESFSTYLRAGRLKVADRFPFLDPFAAEFEYLAGEIVFVGKAAPSDFIAGLTEALSHAVTGVVQSSPQPRTLHARIANELGRLLERKRAELEIYGLDRSIEQIASA